MAKSLTITDPSTGTEYTLEFNRKSVEILERTGFVAEDVAKKPVTMLPALFAGAFRMHHPSVKREVIDGLYARIGRKDEFITALVEMYNEPIMALLDEPTESGDEKNLDWKTNW